MFAFPTLIKSKIQPCQLQKVEQVAVSAGIPQPHFKKTKQTANNFSVGKSGGARG